MAAAFPIYPAHTAVLSMDCQTGIVSIYTKDGKEGFLARAATILAHARGTGMSVIHVQVGFRPGLPEVSSRNPLFGAMKASEHSQQLFRGPLGVIPRLRSLLKRARSSSPIIASAPSLARISP